MRRVGGERDGLPTVEPSCEHRYLLTRWSPMTNKLLVLLSTGIIIFAAPATAQQQEQDSLKVLQQKVEQLEDQLEQMTDLVMRMEARLRLQEQRALTGRPSGNHQHRPVEISNFDNEVLRVIRGRCSLTQFGSTLTFTCR